MKVKEIGKYLLQDLIGEGSFGKVYRGVDRTSNELVALKFIMRKGKNRKELEGLRQEIEILKKLKHENIIQLRDHIETQNQIILVTEFAGRDLASILQKQRRLKLEEIKNYLRQIVSALFYLDSNRIVHRDLKPQNILIRDGIVKLCDFGFARKMSPATICLHSLKGTPLYIAPEIISEKPYNHKIDIWSLGIILYELSTGIPPFHADTYYKLLPKILHDKVKYPKDMDVELRELIEGMLQKSPSSRYDWQQINMHPFLKGVTNGTGRMPLSEMSDISNRGQSQLEKDFPLDVDVLRPSNLANHNNRVEIEELKQYQEDLRSNRINGKQLKSNVIFYHKLVSLFTIYNSGEKVGRDCLTIAFRVLTLLITKVRLDADQREDDITKKKDLVMSVVNLVPCAEDDELLAQIYNLIAYLLKNNFDAVQVDHEPAESVVEYTQNVLQREKLAQPTLINLLKCVGILANQAVITLSNSEELLKMVLQSRLLSSIASKYQPQREYIIVLECLEKFIHPLKGDQPFIQKMQTLMHSLRVDAAYGFLEHGLVPMLARAVQGYSLQDMEFFWHVFYECVKVSGDFRRAVLTCKNWQLLHGKNRLYSMAVNHCLMKEEKQQLVSLDSIKQEVANLDWNNDNELSRTFQISILHMALLNKPDSKQRFELNKLLTRKAGELLSIDDAKKANTVTAVEGWAFGQPSFRFDDILSDLLASISQQERSDDKEKEISQIWQQNKIYDNIVRVKGMQINLSMGSFCRIVPHLLCYLREGNSNRRLVASLIDCLPIALSEEELCKVRQDFGDEYQTAFLTNMFAIMRELLVRDEKRMTDFYSKADVLNLHRLIVSDYLMTDRVLLQSLPVLLKVLQKSSGSTLDYMAISGLQKLKKLLSHSNPEILLELVQIVSHLARSKMDYYPNIAQIGLIEHIPRYLLSPNELVREKTLNLVGNLAKHSIQFFEDFVKYRVIGAIASTVSTKTNNYEKILKNIVYAVGNISYYNEQFRDDIKPLIPHFATVLATEDEHLMSNTISTLSNLLRHSNAYLKDLIANKIVQRILDIIRNTKNQGILVFSLNFLQKAVQYPEFVNNFREEVLAVLRGTVVGPSDGEAAKKLKKIMEKL